MSVDFYAADEMLKYAGWTLVKNPNGSLNIGDYLWWLDYGKIPDRLRGIRYPTSQFRNEILSDDPRETIRWLGYKWTEMEKLVRSHTLNFMLPHNPDLDDAIRILRNNHWSRSPRKAEWENPSKTQFVNESDLQSDPKGVISAIGLDWDSEMRALNSAWGGSPSKYKGSVTTNGILDSSGVTAARKEYTHYEDDWTMYSPKKECDHEWVTYVGLQEKFEHCKKCGNKK